MQRTSLDEEIEYSPVGKEDSYNVGFVGAASRISAFTNSNQTTCIYYLLQEGPID